MNTYKVGDKVLYNGEVHTVIRVPIAGLTWRDACYLDKDYVVLDLHYDFAIHYTEIEPYYTPHERFLKLGWKLIYNHGIRKTYSKFDDKHSRKTMIINIVKGKDGWYLTANYATYIDKELTAILLEYLEELENEK